MGHKFAFNHVKRIRKFIIISISFLVVILQGECPINLYGNGNVQVHYGNGNVQVKRKPPDSLVTL